MPSCFSEKAEMSVTRKRYDGLPILHEYFTGSNLGIALGVNFIWVLFLI